MATSDLTPDLCIIGAGSAGLSIAAGAVQMGASVVLIERGEMGGDCLNYGCIPSKALLAAGKQAETLRNGAKFGIAGVEPEVDFKAVMAHVHGVIATIAPVDSQERFEGLGVHVIREEARFKDKRHHHRRRSCDPTAPHCHRDRISTCSPTHPWAGRRTLSHQ